MVEAATQSPALYGLMAEFETPEALTTATRQAVAAGYKQLDAYSPFPIEELAELVAKIRTRFEWLPYLVLGGGITGALLGFSMQYYIAAVNYPVNIGGRPFNSWPSFTVVTFEMTILVAAFAAVFGMILLNGLPLPYHPVFNVPRFTLAASSDRFFWCIEATDPQFEPAETRAFLQSFQPISVTEVEAGSET